MPIPATPELKIQIPDSQAIARRLSAVVQVPTISYEDRTLTEPFLELHRLLEQQYPRVHQTLQREKINELSLLYTWPGSQPELPGVAFLAHQDVVPVIGDQANWTHPAFSGAIEAGYVWGRGSIDMKSQLVAVLEAAETLLAAGFQPKRTIYLAFGHDEETGGKQGAHAISAVLQARGVHFAALMDEGGAVSGGVAPGIDGLIATVAYAEKAYANITLEVKARAGHASTPFKTSSIAILSRAITRIQQNPMPASLEFARPTIQALLPYLPLPFRLFFSQLWLTGPLVKLVLAEEPFSNALLRNTIAPTILQSGYKFNVLPEKASAGFNCRLLPGRPLQELLDHFRKVIRDERVSITCVDTSAPSLKPVSLDTPFYHAMETNIRSLFGQIPICPLVMFGSSDSRHYENICSSIYRFEALRFNKPEDDLTHGVDERVEIAQLPAMVDFNLRMMQSWACL